MMSSVFPFQWLKIDLMSYFGGNASLCILRESDARFSIRSLRGFGEYDAFDAFETQARTPEFDEMQFSAQHPNIICTRTERNNIAMHEAAKGWSKLHLRLWSRFYVEDAVDGIEWAVKYTPGNRVITRSGNGIWPTNWPAFLSFIKIFDRDFANLPIVKATLYTYGPGFRILG